MQISGVGKGRPIETPPDTKKWHTIYPAYISKNKTKPLGRRIPLEKAVEYPHPMEVAQVCQDLGLKFVVEVRARPLPPSAGELARALILERPLPAGQSLFEGCVNARASQGGAKGRGWQQGRLRKCEPPPQNLCAALFSPVEQPAPS